MRAKFWNWLFPFAATLFFAASGLLGALSLHAQIPNAPQLANSYYNGQLSNWYPDHFKFWRKALANVRAGSARGTLIMIGDSQMNGTGAGTSTCGPSNMCGAYSQGAVADLAALMPSFPAQSGKFNASFNSLLGDQNVTPSMIAGGSTYAGYDTRVTLGANWSVGGGLSLGGQFFQWSGVANNLSFLPGNAKFDTIKILYPVWDTNPAHNSTFTVNVDGASIGLQCANVSEVNATTTSYQIVTCPMVTNKTYTSITVVPTAGTSPSTIYIHGIMTYDSTAAGVDVLMAGISGVGAATSGTNFATAVYPWDPLLVLSSAVMTLPTPTTVISLAGADVVSPTPTNLTTYQANLSSIVSVALCGMTVCSGHPQLGDVLLMLGPPAGSSNFSSGAYLNYDAVVYQLAQQYGVPVLDMRKRLVSYVNTNPILPYADINHPGRALQQDIALAIYEALLNP